jgi:hypothetical protein
MKMNFLFKVSCKLQSFIRQPFPKSEDDNLVCHILIIFSSEGPTILFIQLTVKSLVQMILQRISLIPTESITYPHSSYSLFSPITYCTWPIGSILRHTRFFHTKGKKEKNP